MHSKWSLLRFLILLSACNASQKPEPTDEREESFKEEPKKAFSLAESIRIAKQNFQDPEVDTLRKQYWKKTFDDIKNLTGGFPLNNKLKHKGGSFFSQWKLLLDDFVTDDVTTAVCSDERNATVGSFTRRRTRRFDGFASWDRLLQDWADDVQDYLERAQAESSEGYMFGNFGRPTTQSSAVKQAEEHSSPEVTIMPSKEIEENQVGKKERVPLPVPSPREPGEAVLPHTDISDKSKRILVVTTASLPWKTGTAVNPLLRAAYLTKGRKEAGGSVTLMLPWLERPVDQARVYGENNAFESPQAQEEYIRKWLRESAGMAQASEDLLIQWYTAWQNPVENSIYSMGDITALIPAESIDVCILEEPEHLNW